MPAESSFRGGRINSQTGRTEYHHGYDYPAPIGSQIYLNKQLTITNIGEASGFGKRIEGVDSQGNHFIFAHLDSYPPNIKTGDTLPPGSLVGYVGNTGSSRGANGESPSPTNPTVGAHLHYEVRLGGRWGNSADPGKDIDPETNKPFINSASFKANSNPNDSSLRNSTPVVPSGYTQQSIPGPSFARPFVIPPAVVQDNRNRGNRVDNPDRDNSFNEAEARRLNRPYVSSNSGIITNPVLKLGDKWID